MKFILIFWHTCLADMEDDELTQRTKDGSASDVWAARVRQLINWRRQHIAQLREENLELLKRLRLV